jgi:hypothetical protein
VSQLRASLGRALRGVYRLTVTGSCSVKTEPCEFLVRTDELASLNSILTGSPLKADLLSCVGTGCESELSAQRSSDMNKTIDELKAPSGMFRRFDEDRPAQLLGC